MKCRVFLFLTATQLLLAVSVHAETRAFTSTDGRKIQAEPVKVANGKAVLNRPGVGNVTVPLSKLSAADQKYLMEWAEKEKGNRIPKIELRINTNKRDRREENAYEDRRGQFQFEIEIENEERNFDIKGAQGTLIAFGDYMEFKGEGIIMERTQFKDIDVVEGETHKVTGKLVKFEYDKDGYKHGQKYTGYLFELRNAQGKVIERRGSTPRVENDAGLILKLRVNDRFDERTFAKVDGSNVRR